MFKYVKTLGHNLAWVERAEARGAVGFVGLSLTAGISARRGRGGGSVAAGSVDVTSSSFSKENACSVDIRN